MQSNKGELDADMVLDRRLGDVDLVTDTQLERENKDRSKGTVRLKKIVSMIVGNKEPSRFKVFYSADSTSDLRLWTIEVNEKTVHCGRVHNPAVLRDPGSKKKSKKTNSTEFEKTWSQLARVERLEIEDAEGTMTELPKHIATSLKNLTSLSMTWTHVKCIPTELFLLPLTSLNVQRNHLKNLVGVEQCRTLTSLDASNNQLEVLPKAFGSLVNLVSLNVSANQLRELPDSLGELCRLKTLDCAFNKLRTLPDTVCDLLELTSIDVCGNQLDDLPESIGRLPCLDDLRARGNMLASLPESFSQLTGLQSLLLRKNHFDAIPPQLRTLPNLHSLNLRDNKIRSVDVALPPSLKTLILDYNELTTVDKALTSCVALKSLSLSYNQIRTVPPEIHRLKELQTLNLSGNDVGHLPPSLAQLVLLKHLSLNETQMRDVPNVVLGMTQLTQVDLDDCVDLDPSIRAAYKVGGITAIREYYQAENNTTMQNAASSSPRTNNTFDKNFHRQTLFPQQRGGQDGAKPPPQSPQLSPNPKSVTFEMTPPMQNNFEKMRGTTNRYSTVETLESANPDYDETDCDRAYEDNISVASSSDLGLSKKTGNKPVIAFGFKSRPAVSAKPQLSAKPAHSYKYMMAEKCDWGEGEEILAEGGTRGQKNVTKDESAIYENITEMQAPLEVKIKRPPPQTMAKPAR